jgi:hypothetical protein
MVLSSQARRELEQRWLPNLTDAALQRLIDLLGRGDPRLIQRNWSDAGVRGCLATHVAWNDPRTERLGDYAGAMWLQRVAGVPNETSTVVRDWDLAAHDPWESWELRGDLLRLLREEQIARHDGARCPQAASETCSTASPTPKSAF